jgi:hypothetical protein
MTGPLPALAVPLDGAMAKLMRGHEREERALCNLADIAALSPDAVAVLRANIQAYRASGAPGDPVVCAWWSVVKSGAASPWLSSTKIDDIIDEAALLARIGMRRVW